jgi:hypothetical protein
MLSVRGIASDEFGTPQINVRASCGGITVQCSGVGGCENMSTEIATEDDVYGSCTVMGSAYGGYVCNSIRTSGAKKDSVEQTGAASLR